MSTVVSSVVSYIDCYTSNFAPETLLRTVVRLTMNNSDTQNLNRPAMIS